MHSHCAFSTHCLCSQCYEPARHANLLSITATDRTSHWASVVCSESLIMQDSRHLQLKSYQAVQVLRILGLQLQ